MWENASKPWRGLLSIILLGIAGLGMAIGSGQATPIALADAGFSNDYAAIETAAQSVMMLVAYDEDGETLWSGSGFAAFDNRTLVTNHHVMDGAAYILAFNDAGDSYDIYTWTGVDAENDIAILRFRSPTDLQPLQLVSDERLMRGQPVVVIGSPLGVKNSVSIGNISAIYEDVIMYTAPTSPGSSGGAVFNNDGDVIGLHFGTDPNGENMNLAVPIGKVVQLHNATRSDEPNALADYHRQESSFALDDAPTQSAGPAAGSRKVPVADEIPHSILTVLPLETYPEIWLTLWDYNLLHLNGIYEDPQPYLRFTPPEGALPMMFSYMEAKFYDPQSACYYTYSLEPHYYSSNGDCALENFTKGKDVLLFDDENKMAIIYYESSYHTIRAMICLETWFGLDGDLYVMVEHESMDAERFIEAGIKEYGRVLTDVQITNLDHFWSEQVYTSAEIGNYWGNHILINTREVTLGKVDWNIIEVSSIWNDQIITAHFSMELVSTDRFMEYTEKRLKNGTPFFALSSDEELDSIYTYMAYFPIGFGSGIYSEDVVYLVIWLSGDGAVKEYVDALDEVYSLVTCNPGST